MGRTNKNKLVYALFGVTFVLIVSSVLVFLSRPLEVKEFEVIFFIKSGGAGFDLNGTALTFGSIPPGGAGRRSLIIENKWGFPVEARFFVSKDIAEFIEAPSSILLHSRENTTLEIVVRIPKDTPDGKHKGKIKIKFYRVTSSVP